MTTSNTRRGFTQQGNVVIKNKVILNLIQDLQRLALLFLNNMRGRSRIKYGMTPLCYNSKYVEDTRLRHPGMTPNWITTHGFTLIELLVGVLIIGLLAAVALPQYQKAVKRAQGREIVTTLKILDKAYAAYYLENGTFKDPNTQSMITIDELSVSIPNLTYFNWSYFNFTNVPGIYFSHKKDRNTGITFRWDVSKSRFAIVPPSQGPGIGVNICDYLDGGVLQAGSPDKTQKQCVFKTPWIY